MRKNKLLSWLLAVVILWNIIEPAAAASAEGMEQMTEDTQHTAHSYVGDACTECGEPHTDHSYADGICTVCGCSHTAHTYENRTETVAMCTVCGYSHTHTAAEGSVCEVCGFAPEGADPEEQPKLSGTSFHSHAICGNAGCTNAAHIAQVFQPIPAEFTGGALAGGSYYLDRDIALTDSVAVGSADRVYLCLNGRSLQAPDGAAAISGEGQVYLCDCTGTKHAGTPTGSGIWVLEETTETRSEDQSTEPRGNDEPTHTEHTWQNGVCTGCEAAHTPHEFTNPSETGAVCSVCGYSHTHTVAAGSTCEVCGFAQPASAHSHPLGGGQGNMEFQPIPADFTGGELSGSYYLDRDITLTASISIPQAGTLNLCLNGHVLNGGSSGSIFQINNVTNATLNITDCCTTEHKFTPNGNGLWVPDEANGTKTVTGGVITGGTGTASGSTTYGGVFFLFDSTNTVNFYGGNIVGNTANRGGVLWMNTGARFNVYGGNFRGNTASQDGGVFNVDDGTLTIGTGVTICDNVAGGDGGAIKLRKGTVTTTGAVFARNESTGGDAGAIYVVSADAALISNNTNYTGNKAKKSGGAIFALTGAAVTIDGGTLNGNKTTHQTNDGNGGAIGAWNDTKLTIKNATFTENESLWGGAVRTNNASVVTIENSTFTGNKAVKYTAATGYGGAIRTAGTGNAVISGCTFIENTAARSGGAIYAESPVTISNTTITDNAAGLDGGAADGGGLALKGSYAFSLNHVTLQSNSTTAGGRGGGVLVEKGTLTLGGKVVIDGNTLASAANNLHILTEAVAHIGTGGLAEGSSIGYTMENSTHGAVIVSSGAVETDVQYFSADGADLNVQCRYEAHENGKLILKIPAAHVYNNGTCSACGYAHMPHTYNNGTCTACGYAHTPHTYNNGTCTVCSYVHTDHAYTDTTDTGASCSVCGYAHTDHTYENGTCTICSHAHANHEYTNITNLGAACTICGYAHTHTYGEDDITCAACGFVRHYHPLCGAACTCGGSHSAMEFTAIPADFTGGELSGSYYLTEDLALTTEITVAADTTLTLCLNGHVLTAPAGSRAVTVNGTLNLTDCGTAEYKFRVEESGLWVLDENGTETVTGGVITGGNAGENGYGGAIHASAAGTVRMYGGTIVGNTAGLRGGGVYTAGVFTLYGGSIVGNTVNSSGGGVFSDQSGECYIYGGTISDNTANIGSGGGIYAEKMEMTGGVISGNTVTGGSGGGIYGTHITISGGSITGNAAKGSGGGINVGTLMLTGGQITGNRAESGGGGAYGRGSGTQTLTGGQITGNTITGDTVNDVPNNMQLETAGTIQLHETMAEDSAFGIYGQGEFAAPCDTDYSAYFTSDNGYTIVYTAGKTLAARSGAVHHHAISGGQGNLEFLPMPEEFTGGELAGSYYLDGDITLTTEITVAADTTLNLCLNGHVLTAAAGSRAITVNGGELNLTDCRTTAHKFTVGADGLWVRDEANGTETVTGGVITGGNADSGGAIYGECPLVTVDENPVKCESVIRMYGGNLVGNTATNGGGVYSQGRSGHNNSFALYGGSIVGNKASRGGGIYTGCGTLALCGGEISGNTALVGGGVYAADELDIQASGAPVIRSNRRSGEPNDQEDNLHRYYNSTKLTITGGLTEGASIGISGEGEFTNPCDTDYSAYFTSDDGCTVMYTRTKTLAAYADQSHPLCGRNCSHSTSHENVTFQPLPANFTGGELSGSYYLAEDVTLSSTITVPEGQALTLCLNGKVLTAPTNKGAITVRGTLNLTDCKATVHTFTPNSNGLWVRDEQNGTETVTGGVITSGSVDCGGIHIEYGSMTMYGGNITGNMGFFAGGVYLDHGSMTMYGGSISGNRGYGSGGGGVSAKYGTLTMHGGSITGNTASSYGGGGVYATKDFVMHGGTITDNTAVYGGGVCLEGDGNMQMHGGSITGNTVIGNGGGICVCDGTRFAMFGGEITGNAAGITGKTNVHGGGVAVQSNGVSLHGGKITGNTRNGAANNIQPMKDEWRITLEETLAEDSTFGISGEGVFTVPCSTDHSAHFTPDADGGAIVYLADQTLAVYSHYHPLCAKSCTHSGQHGNQAWQALTASFTGGELTGSWYLAENVALTDDAITVPAGQTLNLCLNGKVLMYDTIIVNGTLNLCDCGTEVHKFTPFTDGQWDLREEDGTKTVTGGVVMGYGRSGVTMNAGSEFVMYGGNIVGGSGTSVSGSGRYGGGVYQSGGSFTIYGGSILGNTAIYGGGVYLSGGSFTMYGGSITDNTARFGGDGGVRLDGGGMTMYGGAITGNVVARGDDSGSGGISLHGDSTLTLYGGTITGNLQYDRADNISLKGSRKIILGETMAEGSSFGIYNKGVFAEACEIDHSRFFTSDRGYSILYLEDKTLAAYYHYHPLCGESCTCGGSHEPEGAWSRLGATGGIIVGNDYYYLNRDVTLSSPIMVQEGQTMTICLNGHVLRAPSNGSAFIVNGTLNLCDCGAETGNGKITGGSSGVTVNSGGSFTMYGGKITGSGSGVTVNGGSFTMNGGQITENTSAGDGGGVYQTDGSFTMNGGTITGNTAATDGGGVYLGGGTLTLHGGSITGNTVNNANNNIMLDSGEVITLGDTLAEDSHFGIYGEGVFTNACDTDYSDHFTSDNGHTIVCFADKKTLFAGHYHPLCGESCTCGGEHGNEVWWPLSAALTGGYLAGNCYLTEDVTLTEPIEIPTGMTLNLCLNGKILRMSGSSDPAILVGDESTLNLCDCGTTQRKLTQNNGVWQPDDAAGTKTITGGGIIGGQGGAVQVLAACTMNLYGGNIIGNGAAQNGGGGVYVNSGMFNMYGGSITDNNAYRGGGVCLQGGGGFRMYGGTIADNTAAYIGGGVYIEIDCGFYMYGGSITGNTAAYYGGGAYVEATGTFTMHGGSITGNTASTDGGGVYLSGSANGINLNGGTITGNTVNEKANNIRLNGVKIALGDSLPEDASFGIRGEGVFTKACDTDHSARFTSDNGYTIVYLPNNTLMACGHYHPMCGESCTHSVEHGNEVWLPWPDNFTGGELSGSYYLTDNVNLTSLITVLAGQTLNLCLNGKVLRQTANPADRVMDVYGTLNLTDCGEETHKFSINGQIWTLDEENGTETVNGGVITGGDRTNSGSESGHCGGVYVGRGASFHMYGGNIVGNRAYNGGGVFVSDGTFTLHGGSVQGNYASRNGGGVGISVYSGYNASFIMEGGQISHNIVGDGTGGGVRLAGSGSSFTMNGGEIAENKAFGTPYSAGGGVSVEGGSTFTMNGGSIRANECGYGGGVSVFSGTFRLKGGSITDNVTRGEGVNQTIYNGGGVYVAANGSFIVSGAPVVQNNTNNKTVAAENVWLVSGKTITIGEGGLTTGAQIGIYGEGVFAAACDTDSSAYFTSDNGLNIYHLTDKTLATYAHYHSLCGKSCTHEVAHAAMNDWQPLTETFTGGNLASGNYYLGSDITLTAPITFEANAVVNICLNGHVLNGGSSGSIFKMDSAANVTLNITDCGEAVHKFTRGGDGLWVLNEANGTKTVTGGVITGGTGTASGSTTYGGAIYMYGNNTVHIYGGNFVGNMATQMGGAVYLNGGTDSVPVLKVYGGGFYGNVSSADGGAIGASAGTIIIDRARFEENKAATSGGAIYTLSGYTSSNTAYIGNTARGSGAVWTQGTATVANDTYQGNKTTEWDAGAIYVNDGTLSIDSATFTGNTAAGHSRVVVKQ